MANTHSYEDTFLQNRFLLENLQGGIVYSDFDPPFHLRYATEGMARLSGYTIEELVTMEQMDIVYEDDIPELVEDVTRQFEKGDTFEVEYRLKRKDGSCVYVLDRAKVVEHEGGEKFIHCLLTDISDLKEMEKALKLNQEKYKIAIQQSGNVIVEYDTERKVLTFSENYQVLFGCQAPAGTLKEIMAGGWVDPQYEHIFLELFDEVVKSAATCSRQLRIRTSKEKSVWCSLYLTPVINNGHLYSIIGCLENIDEEKHTIEHLTELSHKDSLTGVYNRYAVESFVKNQISCVGEDQLSALLILDIDYFKQINDQYGHDYGDEVLIKLAKAVGSLIPSGAVFGRLGGDEFLIYVTLKRGERDLRDLAGCVVEGVRRCFEKTETPVTISVGAAWRSEECNTFKALYRMADAALYETKKKGRDGYTVHE